MSEPDNYLTPEARAALERELFEAVRDVLYAEGKAEYSGGPGFVALAEEVQRDAFLRHMEREWPSVQLDLKAYSDARLEAMLAECVERGDVLGSKDWQKVSRKPTFDEMLREAAKQAEAAEKAQAKTPGRER
jgi:hypothetical protein